MLHNQVLGSPWKESFGTVINPTSVAVPAAYTCKIQLKGRIHIFLLRCIKKADDQNLCLVLFSWVYH